MSCRPKCFLTFVVVACLAAAGQGCKKEPSAGGSGTPARVPADTSTPKSACLAFSNAMSNGDKVTLRECVTGSEDAIRIMEAMSEMAPAAAAFHRAAQDKYGKDSKLAKMFPPEKIAATTAQLEAAEYKVDGDVATVVRKDQPNDKRPTKLKREGGKWKVDLMAMGQPPSADKATKRFAAMAVALRTTADEILLGKHATPDAAEAALNPRLEKAARAE